MKIIVLSALLITATAIYCFLVMAKSLKNVLSNRLVTVVYILGSVSWLLQMFVLWLTPDNYGMTSFICVLLGMGCLLALLVAGHLGWRSQKAVAQALLWGIFVFPLVLISILPNGIWTLFAALGFS